MKANEAPEKIWIDSEWIPHFDCKDCITENSIEYTRTDAFIEKAVVWISNNCYIPHSTLEDFKNYMKGE